MGGWGVSGDYGKVVVCGQGTGTWGSKGDKRGEPKFFESDGYLYAIGSLGCVEIDIGGFVG